MGGNRIARAFFFVIMCAVLSHAFCVHTKAMPKRSRTGRPDVNQMAANLIDAISGDLPIESRSAGSAD